MAKIYLGNVNIGGSGIVPVNDLPTANQENYNKHELYLNDGELSYLNSVISDTPIIENKSTSLRNGTRNIPGLLDNKIYRIGGQQSNTAVNVISYFDIESNTETTLDITLPVTLYNCGFAQKDNFVYIIGGLTSGSGASALDSIYKINLTNMSITELSTKYPSRVAGCSSSIVGDYIYTFGGGYALNGWVYLKTITMFDTISETITTLNTELPNTNYTLTTISTETNIYIVGGTRDSNIYLFDTINQTIEKVWTYDSSVGISNFYFYSCFVVGDLIYLIGGYSNQNKIFTFDMTTNTLALASYSLPHYIDYSPIVEETSKNTFYVVNATYAEKISFTTNYSYETLASSDVGGN